MDIKTETPTTHVGHSKQVHGALVLVLVLLAAFLFAETIKALKEYRFVGAGIPAANVITVSGEGEVFAVPDTAVFSFAVAQEAADAGAVQEAVKKKMDDIVAALKEKGIEESDTRTIAYELHPKYEYEQPRCVGVWPCPPGKQVQKGFTLTQTIEVKVRELAKAGEVIGVATEKGATNISNLSFTVRDEDAKKAEARAQAIAKAREQATKLAEELGVSLVRIVNFSEFGDYQPYYGMMDAMPLGKGGDMLSANTAPTVPVGENSITSQVSVSYEIR